MHLHERMDKLFSNGSTWNHRTLRTLFDVGSYEWSKTTMDEKHLILDKIVESGESITSVYLEYVDFYSEEKGQNYLNQSWQPLIHYLEYFLTKYS